MITYYHCTRDSALLLSFSLTCHPYFPFHFYTCLVHPGINFHFDLLLKKKHCELALCHFLEVITTDMASLLTDSFPWKRF